MIFNGIVYKANLIIFFFSFIYNLMFFIDFYFYKYEINLSLFNYKLYNIIFYIFILKNNKYI